MTQHDDNIVYSTDTGRVAKPSNKANSFEGSSDGVVRVKRETKGRKGKGVTTVTGIPGTAAELKKIAQTLKKRCSTGGALKDGIIEIQGDQRDVVKAALEGLGFKVKLAGG